MTEKRFSQGYAEYIRSEGWREKAQLRKAIDGNRCVLCGSADNLQVHHVTYERLGHEDVERDLVTLCMGCHEYAHENKEYIKGGIIKGVLLCKIDMMPGRLEGLLCSLGLGKVANKYADMWRSEMQILYIPVPEGGACTVPFAKGFYSDKDAQKMCNYLGEDLDALKADATKIYHMALESNGYVGDVPAAGVMG